MWSKVAFCLLAAAAVYASSSAPAWKENTEYIYSVRGRSLTSLDKVSNQYSGIQLKSKLILSLKSNGMLRGRLTEVQYAQIHTSLPHGFNQHIPESEINYKPVKCTEKPFDMKMESGLIHSLTVENDISRWELNMIKSVMSQFQLDVHGKNMIQSPINIRGNHNDAVFKTKEVTVTGKTETLYEIHELPEFWINVMPELVPQGNLKNEGELIEVVKTQNFTNSFERPSYHFGLKELNEAEPTANSAEGLLSRSSHARAILTGKLSRFTIQTIYAVDKILVTPTENYYDMSSVESALNISLIQVQTRSSEPEELLKPLNTGDLVYSSENFMYSELTEKDKSSQESQSAENTRLQPVPALPDVPEVLFLNNFLGYHGQIARENRSFDLTHSTKELFEQIRRDLEDTDTVLIESTLSKYTILCSLVRYMNEKQLKSFTDIISSESRHVNKRDIWYIFRDAVAESGTGPAILTIQQWIQSGRIEKWEAGLIVTTMMSSVRTPTLEYMRKLFEIVQSPEVASQSSLNETAILSYSNLVYQVYVDEHISHNQYPVHSFGNFSSKEGKEFVREIIIPYFAQQLDKAVSEADSRKIHVFIRALGNTGHKMILSAFEKYLEGEKQCSQFQRLMMVVSLNKLAILYPEIARAVLYRIYQNPQEVQQIRVAAVYQLIRTNPPREMLQRMAVATNFDQDQEVNAAVKSVIENIIQLENPSHENLRKAGESAKPLLNNKVYNVQNRLVLKDYAINQMKREILSSVHSMAKPESYWPNVLRYSVGKSLNQLDQQIFNMEYMVSSVAELINVLQEQTQSYQDQRSQRSQQNHDKNWSSAKIADLLKIDINQKEQLEGLFYSEIGPLTQIWSLNNHSLETLTEEMRKTLETLHEGKRFDNTKMGHAKQITLSFPTILGQPFIYTYDVPMLMKSEGKMKMKFSPENSKHGRVSYPEQILGEYELDVTFSGKIESHTSFITPFDHQHYVSGFTRNLQLSLPIRASYKFDLQKQNGEVKIDTSRFDSRRIVHYSAWPFTSTCDVLSILPFAKRPNTHIIKKDNQRHFENVINEKSSGVALKIWGNHPKQSLNMGYLMQIVRSGGPLAAWQTIIRDNNLQQCEYNFGLLPGKTSTKQVTLHFGHKSAYYDSQEKENSHQSQWNKEDFKEMSTRLNKMMELASSGVKSAIVNACDMSVEFEGQTSNNQVSLTFGLGKSKVNPRSNLVAFAAKTNGEELSRAGIKIKSHIKNTNSLDVSFAMQNKPLASMEYEAFYQPSNQQKPSQIKGSIQMKRSEYRKHYLVEQPEYEECKREMQQGNKQLRACANMTIRANLFDEIEINMRPENINEHWIQTVQAIYQGIQMYYYPELSIDKQNNENHLYSMEVRFQPDFEYLNVSVQTPNEKMKIQDISINGMIKSTVQSHNLYRKTLAFENYRATCVLDKTAALTFDDMLYPVTLDDEWTVMMQYVPQRASYLQQSVSQQLKSQLENYVVLVREQSQNQKQVKIIFNSPETSQKVVEITLNYDNEELTATGDDGNKLLLSKDESTNLFKRYVQFYKLPNAEVKVEFGDVFHVIFDGERVKITATNDKLRQSVVGLCGRFDNNLLDEMQTPENCFVRSFQQFVNSYKLDQSRRSFERSQCIPWEYPRYVNVISEGIEENSWLEYKPSEFKLRQRYVEIDGQMCFTTHPVPVCQNEVLSTVPREVPVHCVANSKTADLFKKQIDQGGNPDFSHKKTAKIATINVDKLCA